MRPRDEVASTRLEARGTSRPTPALTAPTTSTVLDDSDRLDLQRRADQLRLANRSLSDQQARDLAQRSDRFREELEQEGIVDVDLYLRHEINDISVTDEELLEYYELHRSRFGERSFEESRAALESMVRLKKIRESHDGGAREGDELGGRSP